ncbi:MAG: molybdopterin molybdotransferase MoeA [Desulfomonile sp.]|nr:molybdopterin molybdotransferase MoeA [Desulfomonile sp.]
MIDIGEAQRQVLEEIPVLGTERIHILEALGRVLAQDVTSSRNVPMCKNSAMDGYACRHEDLVGTTLQTPARLRLVGESPAGKPYRETVGAGEAVRITTGGVIPPGADTVVMVENTELQDQFVAIFAAPPKGAHIRDAGEDVKAGELVLSQGTVVRPPEVGMLATLGHAYVHVFQRPIVAILSTGDELVDLDEPLTEGKVVCSNSYSLAAQVTECGGIPISLGMCSDDGEEQQQRLYQGLRADVIVTSGGVSVGKYDLVQDSLSQVGVNVKFWKVAMKPGKPLVFGTIGNKPVFGLPGNPTSAMTSFEQFVRPALLKMMGHTRLFRPTMEAVLAEDVPSEPGRLHLVRCALFEENGQTMARSTGTQSSGALRSMVLADGLMIVPPVEGGFSRGAKVKVQLLHSNAPLVASSPFW